MSYYSEEVKTAEQALEMAKNEFTVGQIIKDQVLLKAVGIGINGGIRIHKVGINHSGIPERGEVFSVYDLLNPPHSMTASGGDEVVLQFILENAPEGSTVQEQILWP